MKTLKLDDETEIVVVRTSGKLHAIGSKCPHYGGPLGKGSICDGKVRCPWHGASFSLETGRSCCIYFYFSAKCFLD